MPITFLAQSTSDNAPGGAVLTFAFPIILFAIIAVVLYYLLFARPHRAGPVPADRAGQLRLPGRRSPGRRTPPRSRPGCRRRPAAGAAESATEPAGAKRDTAGRCRRERRHR